jgi:POT family proton-dependent oligopeptide transporter
MRAMVPQHHPSNTPVSSHSRFGKMDVKRSLEVTKGASMIDPIPLDTSTSNSIDGKSTTGDALLRPFPTEEELATLPRVAGSIPWQAWTVAFVEFAERFSYYGTSAVCEYLRHVYRNIS